MTKLIFTAIAIIALINVQAQKTKATIKSVIPAKISTAAPAFKNSIDSFSYAAGMSVGESLKGAGATKINSQLFAKAMDEVYANKKTTFTKEQANMTLQEKLQAFNKKKTDAQKADGLAFCATNKKRAGVITIPSGIQYEVIKAGAAGGTKPNAIDTVVVNYIGTLINGTEFDNSYKRGQATTFPLNGVIRGWTEILQLMVKGDKWKVYIPSDLAYGANPPSAQIPPNAVLIFEIALEDIKPAISVTK